MQAADTNQYINRKPFHYFRGGSESGSDTIMTVFRDSLTRGTARTHLIFLYHLRQHLNESITLINTMTSEVLSIPATSHEIALPLMNPVQVAQCRFAIHYIGISETLLQLEHLTEGFYGADRHILHFGFPIVKEVKDGRTIYDARCYFAHELATPKQQFEEVEKPHTLEKWVALGEKIYAPLLKLVRANIHTMEVQVNDPTGWMPPPPSLPQAPVDIANFPAWQNPPAPIVQANDEEEEEEEEEEGRGGGWGVWNCAVCLGYLVCSCR